MSDVIVITGAGSGFGLLSAIELAARGRRVFATLRDLGRAERLDAAAKEAGVTVEKAVLDVTRPESIARAVADIEGRAGRIDVLVNNAGYGLGGFFEDVSLDELREQFETNFFGVAGMIKAVLPGMRARRQGRIVNVSSISGRLGTPGVSAYCASKFAVEGLTESIRHELRPLGIWVTLVEPGSFPTDIFTKNRRLARAAMDPASPNYELLQKGLATVEKMLSRGKRDPRDVARVIAEAATVKRPKMRYLVGKDAHGEALAKAVLPFRLIETVVDKYLGR